MILIAGWVMIVLTLLRYAPLLVEAIDGMIEAIRQRNPDAGKDAGDRLLQIAAKVAIELSQRHGVSDEEKRLLAWQMVRDVAADQDLFIGENEARTNAELGYGYAKRKGWIRSV